MKWQLGVHLELPWFHEGEGSEPVIVIHPKENPPTGSVWRELSRQWRTAAQAVCPQGENGGNRVTHPLERDYSE